MLFLFAGGSFAHCQKIIDFLSATPQQGEGIYQLLRRHGLKANKLSYQAFCSLNAVRLTEGDALFPGETYTLPVIDITFDEPFNDVLAKLGVQEFRAEIIEYNKTNNRSFRMDGTTIQDGQRLLIPEPGSGYYEISSATETKSSPIETMVEEDHEYSVPYPEIKKRFKKSAKSTALKNYCFIIDPGHGGDDPGTNPHVVRGDGKEAHAFEAPLVFDTSLRLMKLILENGGEVFLTHYSTRYGIRNIKNPQDYSTQKYNLSNASIGTDNPAQSIRERKRITNAVIKNNYNKGKKVIFLSIHADYLPDKTRDLPITIYYHRLPKIDGGRSKAFALKLAKAITGNTSNTRSMGLGVLYKNPAHIEVLVELVNLNNRHGAWRLRYHSYREKLAGMICDGLIKSLGK